MNMRILNFLVLTGLILVAQELCGQALNTTLRDNWDDNSLQSAGVTYNDLWGWDDGQGREYAIVGSRQFTHFIDVTDPDNIVEVDREPAGGSCLWRDYKTFKHYAYGVSEFCNGGIEIFDLSYLPDSVHKVYDSEAFISHTHNVFIDTASGRLYLTGLSDVNPDIIALDLNANPESPQFIANIDLPFGYVHDLYVRNDTAYCSHGGASRTVIYDFKDIATNGPEMIGQFMTQGYNHSNWVTEDGNTLLIADETFDVPVFVVDISDKETPVLHSTFQSALLAPTGSIAHNPFIIGNDFAILSYYDDGLQIYKIDSVNTPFLAGYYDTDVVTTNYQSNGAWGAYPYLPSGNLLASDIEFGLFVITPHFPLKDCTSHVNVKGTYDNHWDLISKDDIVSSASYGGQSELIMRAPDFIELSPGFTVGRLSTFEGIVQNACGLSMRQPSKNRRK